MRTLDDAVAFAAWARAAGERPRQLTAPPGDERPVEIPWCLARYRGEPSVLDVGYAFAEPAHQAALTRLGAARLVGVDLAAADVPGLEPVEADVRELPFAARVRRRLRTRRSSTSAATTSATGSTSGGGGSSGARELGGSVAAAPDRPDGRARASSAGSSSTTVRLARIFERRRARALRGRGLRARRRRLALDGRAGGVVRYGERGPGASAVLCAELHRRTCAQRAGAAPSR